ncbi:hypothetical protein JCM10914_3015 [Paenibacillus sp. JCM 10914]|nr:hypothetical protein JCM10914_3015 [Paenibacillus sp. JCM 10914]
MILMICKLQDFRSGREYGTIAGSEIFLYQDSRESRVQFMTNQKQQRYRFTEAPIWELQRKYYEELGMKPGITTKCHNI